MKVAFVGLPAQGHLAPTLPVVQELRRRGHAVDYLLTEPLRDRCERAGARFLPIDPPGPPRATGIDPEVGGRPLALAASLLDAFSGFLPTTMTQLRHAQPDVVVFDAMAPWGREAAARLKVPSLASTTTFAMHRSLLELDARAMGGPLRLGRDWLALRKSQSRLRALGVQRVKVSDVVGTSGPGIVFTAGSIQPGRELFGDEVAFVGAPTPERIESDQALPFLPGGEGPLVFASLGTIFTDNPQFFRASVSAARAMPFRLVLSVGSADRVAELGPLPANVSAHPHVPQLAVLRHTDVFLTHGGMNSAHEALHAGVPMVFSPQQVEQRLVARRFTELGAGRTLPTNPDADAIAEAVRAVLEDGSYRRRCADLAGDLRAAGGAAAAADVIERRARPLP